MTYCRAVRLKFQTGNGGVELSKFTARKRGWGWGWGVLKKKEEEEVNFNAVLIQ